MKIRMYATIVLIFCFVFSVGLVAQDPPKTAPGKITEDNDGDGMDDAWEKKYGLNPENPMDGELDLDGDKVNNIDEFKQGTNPTDGGDKDKNGIPDDWEIYYFGKTGIDANGDADKDGVSNLDEFNNGTNPKKAEKKKKKTAQFIRPKPSMDGVKANGDASHKHIKGKNQMEFRDPIGDDKGPGYYTYPTNPVYVKGGFDITRVEIDGSSDNMIVFKVTMNADLKQEWGMAADFDIQFIQIYIDSDGVPGSGKVRTLPGINVYIDPKHAWDRVVLISPQPESRVRIEVEAKAKEFEDLVAVPKKIVGQGKTLIATVLKKDLGAEKGTDITKWKYQVFAQSNEGFPEKTDVLTRDVNEYKGLHRWGGGNDYWGDPEILDMLTFPAKGLVEEAKRQFSILNVWESYPDPTLNIYAVVPMVRAGQSSPVDVKGLAAELAAKMKPKPEGDKYVSENFKLYGKVFTRWNWNRDPSQENFFKNSLEIGIDGKIFTDKLDFYLRFENNKWDLTIWHEWANDTPGQVDVALQSSYLVLVRPLPTIDTITIGNYEVKYSPWVMGAAWYPDRDKYKGLFVDGTIENLLSYKVAAFYPLWWLSIDTMRGANAAFDFTYVAKAESKSLLKGLSLAFTAVMFTDYEVNPFTSNPNTLVLRGTAPGFELNADYKIPIPFLGLSVGGVFALSSVSLGEDFKKLETDGLIDIDGNNVMGGLKGGINNMDKETSAPAMVLNVKGDNFMKTGLNFHVQYFNISHEYCAPGAARGDTAFGGGGFGGASTSGTADVLAMIGNQSAHRAPQAADFTSSIPIPTLPTAFLIPDPQTGTTPIGWINDNWEGIAASGWNGLTVIGRYAADVWRAHAEVSLIGFSHPDLENYSKLRVYGAFNYSFLTIGRGLTLTASFMYENMSDSQRYSVTEGFPPVTTYYSGGAVYMSPWFTADYQLSKTANVSLGFRMEMGSTDDGVPENSNVDFARTRIILSYNMNTPLGFIKTKAEYWFEKEDAANYPSRAPSGAYAITEWEYAF